MITHSENKNFPCELCGSAFRTKGSLIRHNRRHTGTVDWKRGRAQIAILLHVTYAASFPISIISLSPSLPPDERPYRCNLCGLSFRESGALTRHLKSITPCTEKIRFNQYKEILVSKDGQQKGSSLSKD